MNVALALMNTIKRFAAGLRFPRIVEKRTYVFIVVPFNLRGNDHVRKPHVTQDLVGNGSRVDGMRTDAPFSAIAALDRASFRTPSKLDLSDDPELNCDLMWTWFLPNPLWPSNKSKSNVANLFRFGLNGFNANKTRRNN